MARPRPCAEWCIALSVFALAAVLFVLDAVTTTQAVRAFPSLVEQNPVARWALGVNPAAPYLLKGLIVTECAAVTVVFRALGERWAGYVVALLMAVVGLLGIASAIIAVAGLQPA